MLVVGARRGTAGGRGADSAVVVAVGSHCRTQGETWVQGLVWARGVPL